FMDAIVLTVGAKALKGMSGKGKLNKLARLVFGVPAIAFAGDDLSLQSQYLYFKLQRGDYDQAIANVNEKAQAAAEFSAAKTNEFIERLKQMGDNGQKEIKE